MEYPEGFLTQLYEACDKDSKATQFVLPVHHYENRLRQICAENNHNMGGLISIACDLIEVVRRGDPAYGLKPVPIQTVSIRDAFGDRGSDYS